MHEHITRALYYFDIHLLYASIVGFAAWALTSILGGSATTKYWIWVATSLNFILPVGAVLDKLWAPHLSWAAPLGIIGDFANTISQGWTATMLSVVWLLCATLMLTRLCLRIRAERRDTSATAGQSAHHSRPGFLAQAASGDQFEIQSSQLALQSSQSIGVRNFANLMISDHTRLSQAMGAAAASARLQPPAPVLLPAQQALLDQLRASGTGPSFDLAYKQAQIGGHQGALTLFQNYATSGDVPNDLSSSMGISSLRSGHANRADGGRFRIIK